MDKELLTQLIVAFLALNSKPSDAQVHALAGAVNTDHETLEAIMYEMLADSDEIPDEAETDTVVAAEEGLSEEQEVLDGDYDPNTTSPDDLILNDGAPEGTSSQQENQDSLLNDGVGADDVGIDVNSDQSALIDDGAATKTLKAAYRLKATAEVSAGLYTDPDQWEDDLQKKYPKYDTRTDRYDDRKTIAYEDDSSDKSVGYFKYTSDYESSVGYGHGELN